MWLFMVWCSDERIKYFPENRNMSRRLLGNLPLCVGTKEISLTNTEIWVYTGCDLVISDHSDQCQRGDLSESESESTLSERSCRYSMSYI